MSIFRFIGETHFSGSHKIYGIELDASSPNGSNGTINNTKYFQCQPGHGYFLDFEELYREDEKVQEVIQSIDEKPNVDDLVQTFDGKQGTVR